MDLGADGALILVVAVVVVGEEVGDAQELKTQKSTEDQCGETLAHLSINGDPERIFETVRTTHGLTIIGSRQ